MGIKTGYEVSASEFEKRRLSTALHDYASATSLLSARDELAELKDHFGKVVRWMRDLQGNRSKVHEIPSENIRAAIALVDTLLHKFGDLDDPPYELMYRLHEAKRFLYIAKTMPRRMGIRADNTAWTKGRKTYYNVVKDYLATADDISLAHIAARQMGSRNAQGVIADLNAIAPVDWENEEPEGRIIKIPDEERLPLRVTNYNQVIDYPEGELLLGSSIKITAGRGPLIDETTGDYETVESYRCYQQEILHRLRTLAGELDYARWYGSYFTGLVGKAQDSHQEDRILIKEFVRVAMHDPRTAYVADVQVRRDNDNGAIYIRGFLVTIVGKVDEAIELTV